MIILMMLARGTAYSRLTLTAKTTSISPPRDIKEPKNVKLLFDVLRYEPPAIHRAVLFVTNNALVCETPEDASRVAYDLDRSKNSRYDVSHIIQALKLCKDTDI